MDHCRGILYLPLSIRQAFQASINTHWNLDAPTCFTAVLIFKLYPRKKKRREKNCKAWIQCTISAQLPASSCFHWHFRRHILPHLLYITHISPPGISCFQINYPGNASACESDLKAAKTALEQYKYIRACTYDCYPAITYNEFLSRTWRRKKETQHENRTLINWKPINHTEENNVWLHVLVC